VDLPELYDPNDILAGAVREFLNSGNEQFIQVWLNGVKEAPYIASYFLRNFSQMPELEQIALNFSEGKILDIGAGAGPHSAHLIQQKKDVYSIETNKLFCEILKTINGSKVIEEDFFTWKPNQKFDTILLLMNGFGICEREDKLLTMCQKIKSLLNKRGKVLAEITDYNFSDYYDHEIKNNSQVKFRIQYDNKFSKEFSWFYPKLEMLDKIAAQLNLALKVIFQEEEMILLEITHSL